MLSMTANRRLLRWPSASVSAAAVLTRLRRRLGGHGDARDSESAAAATPNTKTFAGHRMAVMVIRRQEHGPIDGFSSEA